MDYVELISTLGFPIVCCVAVGYVFYQMLNKVLSDSKERENNLMNLTREISIKIAELGQIIDKNTENIAIMNERLEQLNDEVKEIRKNNEKYRKEYMRLERLFNRYYAGK